MGNHGGSHVPRCRVQDLITGERLILEVNRSSYEGILGGSTKEGFMTPIYASKETRERAVFLGGVWRRHLPYMPICGLSFSLV